MKIYYKIKAINGIRFEIEQPFWGNLKCQTSCTCVYLYYILLCFLYKPYLTLLHFTSILISTATPRFVAIMKCIYIFQQRNKHRKITQLQITFTIWVVLSELKNKYMNYDLMWFSIRDKHRIEVRDWALDLPGNNRYHHHHRTTHIHSFIHFQNDYVCMYTNERLFLNLEHKF